MVDRLLVAVVVGQVGSLYREADGTLRFETKRVTDVLRHRQELFDFLNREVAQGRLRTRYHRIVRLPVGVEPTIEQLKQMLRSNTGGELLLLPADPELAKIFAERGIDN